MQDLDSRPCGGPLTRPGLGRFHQSLRTNLPRVSACGVLLSHAGAHSATLPGPPWDSLTSGACPLPFLLPCAESPADLGVEKLMV